MSWYSEMQTHEELQRTRLAYTAMQNFIREIADELEEDGDAEKALQAMRELVGDAK